MSDLIVYIDRSDIRETKLEEVKAGIGGLVEFVKAHEPRLIAYGFYFNEMGTNMTVVAIHPDSASLELHLEIAGPAFRKFTELVTLRTIEIYGRPSDRALALVQDKIEMLGEHASLVTHQPHAAFMRFVSS
ncbi:MAG: hypothetical protein WD651_10485 [Acidimicrobiia bacterium]